MNQLVLWAGWHFTGSMNHVAVGDGRRVLEVVPLYDSVLIPQDGYLAIRHGLRYVAEIETPSEVDLGAGRAGWMCVDATVRVIRSGGVEVPTCITPWSLMKWCLTHARVRPVEVRHMEEHGEGNP